MNQDEAYRATQAFDADGRQQENFSGDVPGGADRLKTEVLRPKGPQIHAMLVGVEGPQSIVGQMMRLSANETNTIGRDYSCDIVIDETSVSRHHAKIRIDENEDGELQFFIQDLATENGTEVNGQEILKHYLKDSDRIKLGRAVFVFKQV